MTFIKNYNFILKKKAYKPIYSILTIRKKSIYDDDLYFLQEKNFIYNTLSYTNRYKKKYSLYLNKIFFKNSLNILSTNVIKYRTIRTIFNNLTYQINNSESNLIKYSFKKNYRFSRLLLFKFISKKEFILFKNFFFNMINGFYFGWKSTLLFVNINFKMYLDTLNNTFTLFIGKSHGNRFIYPNNMIVILKKKKKQLILISFYLKIATDLAKKLLKLRLFSKYKNKGIRDINFIVKLKEGKAKQR